MEPLYIIAIAAIVIGSIVYISNQIKSLKSNLDNDENKVLMEWLKSEMTEVKAAVDKSTEKVDTKIDSQRKTLEEQLIAQRKSMDSQTEMLGKRLDESYKVIFNMKEQIGGIQEFGRDLKDLSNVLKSPKLRGGLGEQFLYDILENYIPRELYATQYKFKDGSVCDAVVYIDEEIIPIDSKFPMENFKAMILAENQKDRDSIKNTFVSDVKKRIDEIATKYILPEEGTGDQAIMYIPSENIYYEVAVNSPRISEYARKKKVFMASPNTLVLFLKNITTFYRQKELQKHASEVLKALQGIHQEAEKFNGDLSVLERHITNAFKAMDSVKSKFVKLSGKIENVQSIGDINEKKLIE